MEPVILILIGTVAIVLFVVMLHVAAKALLDARRERERQAGWNDAVLRARWKP